MLSGVEILDWLTRCRHRHLSRVFTIQRQTYRVCLDCGARLRYSWQTMSLELDSERTEWLLTRLLEAARKMWSEAFR